MKTTRNAAIVGAMLTAATSQAGAADFKAGDWDLSVGGSVSLGAFGLLANVQSG